MPDFALITPPILKWARESWRKVGVEEVAQRMKIPAEKILQWEDGTATITIPQLRKLAKIYLTSISTFYLSEPPQLTKKKMIDRRSLPLGVQAFSPRLLQLIEQLEDKQEWLSQNLQERKILPLLLGSFSTRSSVGEIVRDIKQKLRTDISLQMSTRNSREALNLWIDWVESFGINVSSVSNQVPLTEFRAFVMYDAYAPFICLNSKDSPSGRLFSLCHELGHLWLKKSVISNIYDESDETEVLCNKIAANLLIDKKILLDLWNEREEDASLIDQVHSIAHKFSVSDESIARYLCDLEKISSSEYERLRAIYNYRWKQSQDKKRSGGPAYGLKMVLQNGAYFTQQVLSQYYKGALLGTDASGLLGVKINHFKSLYEYLLPRK